MSAPLVCCKARATRARRRAAKIGSGSTLSEPRAIRSKGSAMRSLLVLVGPAERPSGPDEQGLGGVHRPGEVGGDRGDGEVVEITEGERGAVVGAQAVED